MLVGRNLSHGVLVHAFAGARQTLRHGPEQPLTGVRWSLGTPESAARLPEVPEVGHL